MNKISALGEKLNKEIVFVSISVEEKLKAFA